jgi:hypothetical protein
MARSFSAEFGAIERKLSPPWQKGGSFFFFQA